MAEFSKLVVTEKGNALIAKALANTATIKFTKVSSTPTAYEPSELEKLETLSDICQTHLEPKVQRINNTSVEVKAAFNNTELTNGYYIKAFGLYADDPDEGEILYGVAIETSGNCYIPAYNGVTSSGIYLRIVTTVGNSQNVSLEINPAAVATLGDIKELRDELEVVDFDDSGEIEGIESFTDFMSSFVKGTSISRFLANLKAGLKFVLHTGQLVNNGMCETPGEFALDAAYGKTLTDQITGLYSEITSLKWNGYLYKNGVVQHPDITGGLDIYSIYGATVSFGSTNLNFSGTAPIGHGAEAGIKTKNAINISRFRNINIEYSIDVSDNNYQAGFYVENADGKKISITQFLNKKSATKETLSIPVPDGVSDEEYYVIACLHWDNSRIASGSITRVWLS